MDQSIPSLPTPDPAPGVDATDDVPHQILRDHPEFAEPHLLEDDETVPPRPEEEVADAARDA